MRTHYIYNKSVYWTIKVKIILTDYEKLSQFNKNKSHVLWKLNQLWWKLDNKDIKIHKILNKCKRNKSK
jgi:hypothetical protein